MTGLFAPGVGELSGSEAVDLSTLDSGPDGVSALEAALVGPDDLSALETG